MSYLRPGQTFDLNPSETLKDAANKMGLLPKRLRLIRKPADKDCTKCGGSGFVPVKGQKRHASGKNIRFKQFAAAGKQIKAPRQFVLNRACDCRKHQVEVK